MKMLKSVCISMQAAPPQSPSAAVVSTEGADAFSHGSTLYASNDVGGRCWRPAESSGLMTPLALGLDATGRPTRACWLTC